MKPIAIMRHAQSEGPGFVSDFLNQQQLPWQLHALDAGAPLPTSARHCSGLIFMGGPMSVNDELPWLEPALALIREAVAADIPVLGHCLGGQLMSKALGGQVSRNPVKEIGWGTVEVIDDGSGTSQHAFAGDLQRFDAFHWHGETFSLPPGARNVLRSRFCENQAFVLGKHLGLQCHVEMTAAMVRDWCTVGASELQEAASSPGVQSAAAMQIDLSQRIEQLQAVAARIYGRWIEGVQR